MEELQEQKVKISKNLKNLFLDPNNYRFIDNMNYKKVADNEITDLKIQQRTRNFIEGKNRDGVKDLLSSFKSNGFLEVDMIQLKDLGNNNYLVLEGNRRVTALKILQEDSKNGLDIGKFDPKIFGSVPSIIHEDKDISNHLIIMGLKHISGNKKWPAINQAQLIYDYLKDYQKPEYYIQEEILCESLGITKAKLRSTQRAYHLIKQYKHSDYGDQFESDMYYSFMEITKRPSIKFWLNWDDYEYLAQNQENVLRLFSWISYREEIKETIDDEDIDDEEFSKLPPIITKYREIQDLAKFIDNEKALETMEKSGSVAQGLLTSGIIEKESFEVSLNNLKNSIEEIERLKDLISTDDIEDIRYLHSRFQKIIPQTIFIDNLSDNHSICFAKGNISQFSSLIIQKYKIYNEFSLNGLNRINIFAGPNNTGKTTLLEAIYLLTKQNNIGAYFEIIKFRNKLDKLDTKYLNDYIKEDIAIEGVFNQVNTNIMIKKAPASDIDKKDDYITSYKVISRIDGDELSSIVHTFENNPIQRYYEKIEVLCNSIFKSPFFFNKNELVNTHKKNIELKEFNNIVEFIKEFIDKNINTINLTEENDIKRFLIDSTSFGESLDITNYGEGLQRIFEIALSFAYCKNGVLLIDEIETAIHYSLLIEFTKFIQQLADKFNVQVFITSHSKECIGAFIENGYKNDDIAFFTLVRAKDDKIKSIRYDAENLENELNQNLEIRGW